MSRALAVAIALVCVSGLARAQPAPDEPAPEPPPPPPPAPAPPAPAPPPPAESATAPTPQELAERIEDLEKAVNTLQESAEAARETHDTVLSLLPLREFITVYVDVGAFAVGGDGSGIRSDLGHLYFPQYADRIAGQWVFMGDTLSTAINTLGEPADTSDSREIKTDTIRSKGHPSAILNSLGLSVHKDVGGGFAVAALAELLPRPGPDIVDVELANIQYRPSDEHQLVLYAGKIDSVLGVEYRSQDAPNRLGVTPSLICRYTCSRSIGFEARLVEGRLSASAALTNGSSFEERFEPTTQLHASALPMASGHLQWMLPVGQGLEVGVSGAYGPQTGGDDISVRQWHVGLDARLRDLHRFNVTAEYVQGNQPGKTMSVPCDLAPCLTYKGAYVLIDRPMNHWLLPYVRVDWRDAVHTSGVQFVYESHVVRTTVGARFAITTRVLGKVEYTWNHELDGIPQFADDVLTSSLVVKTD